MNGIVPGCNRDHLEHTLPHKPIALFCLSFDPRDRRADMGGN